MINSIAIDNFKQFKNIRLPQLSRVTLIGGTNNAGKTTLLDAIFAVFNRLSPDLILRQYAGKGLNIAPSSPDNVWWPIFNDFDTTKEIGITFNYDRKGDPEERFTISLNKRHKFTGFDPTANMSNPNIATNQPDLQMSALDITYKKNGKTLQVSHIILTANGIVMQTDFLHENPKPAFILGGRLAATHAKDAEVFGTLDIDYKANSIVNFLRELEPRLKGLSTISLGNVSIIYGDIGMKRKVPVAFMGDGTSRLLSILLAIATCKDGMVLIDEIENGIHYSAMRSIWHNIGKAAREYNCQIIATTHSYECIASARFGFVGALQDDLSYVRLDKINDQVVPKIYTYDSISTALDAEMEIR